MFVGFVGFRVIFAVKRRKQQSPPKPIIRDQGLFQLCGIPGTPRTKKLSRAPPMSHQLRTDTAVDHRRLREKSQLKLKPITTLPVWSMKPHLSPTLTAASPSENSRASSKRGAILIAPVWSQ